MAEIGLEVLAQRDLRVEDAGPVFLDGGPERAQGVGALLLINDWSFVGEVSGRMMLLEYGGSYGYAYWGW